MSSHVTTYQHAAWQHILQQVLKPAAGLHCGTDVFAIHCKSVGNMHALSSGTDLPQLRQAVAEPGSRSQAPGHERTTRHATKEIN